MGYLLSLIKNYKYKLQENVWDLTDLQILVLTVVLNNIWAEILEDARNE